jgi:transposase
LATRPDESQPLDEGSSSLPMGGHRRSRIAYLQAQIRSWIEASPGLTLSALSLKKTVLIKESALWHQLNKWDLRFKKNAARPRAGTSRQATGAPQSMAAGKPQTQRMNACRPF